MRRTLLVLLAIFVGAIIGILQPVHGQEYTTPIVVCGPCDGAPWGVEGTGMVVMSSQSGQGSLYFYSLDRSEAVRFVPNRFGAQPQMQTAPVLIGRVSVGGRFVWNEKVR